MRARFFVKQRATFSKDCLFFDFEITNHGRSAAALTYYFADRMPIYGGQELPPEPVYGDSEESIGQKSTWVLPDAKEQFQLPSLEQLILTKSEDTQEFIDVTEGRAKLWVYGLIRYADGVSPREHETRFCYYWAGKTWLIAAGPENFRRCT
jgi:hypothetical protein